MGPTTSWTAGHEPDYRPGYSSGPGRVRRPGARFGGALSTTPDSHRHGRWSAVAVRALAAAPPPCRDLGAARIRRGQVVADCRRGQPDGVGQLAQ